MRQGLIAPDFYKIISAHDGSPGNEHLRPRDIVRLYRFARFLQDNLINRRGILKNERRQDRAYRLVRRATDLGAYATAAVLVRAGRQYFTRTITRLPPAPPGPRGDAVVPLGWRRSAPSMTASRLSDSPGAGN